MGGNVSVFTVYGKVELEINGHTFQLIPLGTFDDSLQFKPNMEIFTNYKVTWTRDNGCLKESFEESAVIERIGAMMENLDQRE